jgi:hypothetical protein
MNLIKELLEMTTEDKSYVNILMDLSWQPSHYDEEDEEDEDGDWQEEETEANFLVKCESNEAALALIKKLKENNDWISTLGDEYATDHEGLDSDQRQTLACNITSIKVTGKISTHAEYSEEEFLELTELDE